MDKVINKIKNYKPSKYVCYLYFFIPIFVCSMLDVAKEQDIWFLLNHGEYVVHHGFPTIEPFTMHQGFSFVMQQWLSAVIFYISHKALGTYGLKLVLQIVNCLMLYFLYKLCMLVSNNKFRLSVVCSCVTQVLILIFFVPRPWIFTFLNLIIVLYIMELFYIRQNYKYLFFLPIISVLQINIQSSMWFMVYLFILPYMVSLIIDVFLKRKKKVMLYKLILIVFMMLFVGLINPYGIDNVIYVFNSYGDPYINSIVREMSPFLLGNAYGNLLFCLVTFYVLILIVFKKGSIKIRYLFLSLGTVILAILNIRSIGLFIIGAIPFLSSYLEPYFLKLSNNEIKYKLSYEFKKKYTLILIIFSVCILLSSLLINSTMSCEIKEGIDEILKTEDAKSVILYTSYDDGSYAEYRGIKPYLDTRAEVFIKKMNHKQDILKEYYMLCNAYIKYDDFIDKYKFTHMLIKKHSRIYPYALKDKRYEVIYSDKKYKVFKRVDDN